MRGVMGDLHDMFVRGTLWFWNMFVMSCCDCWSNYTHPNLLSGDKAKIIHNECILTMRILLIFYILLVVMGYPNLMYADSSADFGCVQIWAFLVHFVHYFYCRYR